MPKIQITKNNKTGQVKYFAYLPKEVMEDLAVAEGDSLLLKSVVGNEITFKFKRKE
jgi:formylmethanofuran dehydrogenase subunit D